MRRLAIRGQGSLGACAGARAVVALLLVWTSAAVAQAPVATMPVIAVLGFEVSDLSGDLAESVRVDMGTAMAAAIEVPLVRSRRFTVVTRVDLEKVLDEVALGVAGFLDPVRAREFGRVAGVDLIVTGTITVIAEDNYSVTVRFIDAETGRISDSATVTRVPGADGFADAGSGFVQRVLERYPLEGSIVAIEGAAAFVDVGREQGLEGAGSEGVVYRVREVAGRAFPVDLGTFRVLQVAADLSLIAPALMAGEELLVGDRVRFASPVSSSEPLQHDTAEDSPPAVATDPGTAAEPGAPPPPSAGAAPSGEVPSQGRGSPEGPSTGSLLVTGSPASSSVFVNGLVVGDLTSGSLDVALPVGDVVLRIEADGFVAEEQPVRIDAGTTTRVEIELIALPDPVTLGPGAQPGVVDQQDDVAGVATAAVRVELLLEPPDARVFVDGVELGRAFALPPGRYSLEVRAAGYVPEWISLVVEGGGVIERVVALRRGESTLVLDVTPAEARVLLDGVEVAERELALGSGIYQLRVEAPGWVAFERRVVLPAGRVERVAIALQPLLGTLVLDVQPANASVSVDGVAVVGGSLSLPVGVRQVVVSAEGFEPASFEVEIESDAVVERGVRLAARPALVVLDVRPSDARVTVNGEVRGAAFEVPAGSYEVVVSHPEYAEERLRLNLVPGERVERVVRLAAAVRLVGSVSLPAAPTYVRLTNPRLETGVAAWQVGFDVGWDASWRGPDRPSWVAATDNWDAVWVFVKYRVDGGAWRHATLAASGHVAPAGAEVSVPRDRMGAFIYRSGRGHGTFDASGVRLQWDHVADGVPAYASTVEVRPFAIEMVFVPQGSFSAGSGGSSTGEFRAGGSSNRPFVVSSQSSINLGNASGQLTWTTGGNAGSPSGSTSASFPTGFGAFYVMKHQVTQGQYVNFLNTLTQAQATARKHTVSVFRYAITGSSVGSYASSLPFVALNYVSWADGAAFADWAGLRPMSELEFEKVARGPLGPVANEFAWGSTSIAQATGLPNAGTITETPRPAGANAAYGGASGVRGPVRVGSFAASGRSRRDAGAGYYGALELSGNLWERPVTVGNAEGRAFAGSHGDGMVDPQGDANVASWPGASAVGAGFRGGSWDFSYDFNLRVSDRFLAALTGANRLYYYGWRGARSAP